MSKSDETRSSAPATVYHNKRRLRSGLKESFVCTCMKSSVMFVGMSINMIARKEGE